MIKDFFKDREGIAEEQARIIDELSALCKQLISELSQYKNCEEEEKRLKELEDPIDGNSGFVA